MKSLVATITLVVLVLTGVLIYKQSTPPQNQSFEQVELIEIPAEIEEVVSTTTDTMATTTATTTEEN